MLAHAVQGEALAPGQALAVLVLTTDLWYGSEGPNSLPSPRVFVARTQDLTPPTFTDGHPAILASSFTSARVSFQLNEPGIVYYAVAPTAAGIVPSVADVRSAGLSLDTSAFMAAGAVNVTQAMVAEFVTVDGLTSRTDFILLAVAEDRYANMMLSIAEWSFTTLDDQPPQFLELQV